MTVMEFLKNDKLINKAELARLMYPNQKSDDGAKVYLTQKLNGSGKVKWLEKDSEKAIKALEKLGKDISELKAKKPS